MFLDRGCAAIQLFEFHSPLACSYSSIHIILHIMTSFTQCLAFRLASTSVISIVNVASIIVGCFRWWTPWFHAISIIHLCSIPNWSPFYMAFMWTSSPFSYIKNATTSWLEPLQMVVRQLIFVISNVATHSAHLALLLLWLFKLPGLSNSRSRLLVLLSETL